MSAAVNEWTGEPEPRGGDYWPTDVTLRLRFAHPPGCRDEACRQGRAKPLDQLSAEDLLQLYDGGLQNHSGMPMEALRGEIHKAIVAVSRVGIATYLQQLRLNGGSS